MKFFGKARYKKGEMNKTELAYSQWLTALQNGGQIKQFFFEAVTLKIGPNCRYTPDFMVITAELDVEFHEVKGFWQDDARVKIKVASEKFPFKFIGIRLVKKAWEREEF